MSDRDALRRFIESREGRTPTEEELDAIIRSESERREQYDEETAQERTEEGEERDPNLRAEDHGESPSRPSWWSWVFRGGS